ncbi:MAG: hypothetical protein J7L31_02030 [Thermoplasmata archaeon]|nr:hypothetical protein [Thermoplasmata archaeon]
MDDETRRIMEEFGNLIDEETAKMLAMEKRGERRGSRIKELREGKTWLYGVVEKIAKEENPLLAVLGDETGHCILKIWEETYDITEGDVIKIVNAWVKRGMRGMEVNVGKYGRIVKMEGSIETKIVFGKEEGLFNLRGTVERIYPTQVYLGKNETFVRKIIVDREEIYLLDEMAKEMNRFKENEEIVLLWLHERNGRIYGDEVSMILKPEEFEKRYGGE